MFESVDIVLAILSRLRNDLYCVEWDVKLYYTYTFSYFIMKRVGLQFLPARRIRKRGNVADWVAGCLDGWLSVTRLQYCIKTAKHILKLFRPSGRPVTLVSSDPAPIPNSKRNPFSGGYKYTGSESGKIGDFRRKSPFISETVRDRPMVTMER